MLLWSKSEIRLLMVRDIYQQIKNAKIVADRLIFGTSTGTIEILKCFAKYINYWSLHKYVVGTKDKVRVLYIA